MSEQTATTVETTPAEAPAAPAAPQSRAERALAALRTARAPAQPAAEAPAAAPAAPEAPKTPPEPAENEDLRRSREQAAYLRYQREAVEAKARAKELEKELEALAVFKGGDAKALHAALKSRGVKLEDLAKAELEGDEPAPPEDPAIKALREKVEAFEREKAEAHAAKVRSDNVAYVGERLKSAVDRFPALASYERAPQMIVDAFEKRVAAMSAAGEDIGDPDSIVDAIAGELHQAVQRDLDGIFASEHALRAYLTRPEVRSRALAILGQSKTAGPASADEGGKGASDVAPTSISSTTAASNGRREARPQSREEKLKAALSNLRK